MLGGSRSRGDGRVTPIDNDVLRHPPAPPLSARPSKPFPSIPPPHPPHLPPSPLMLSLSAPVYRHQDHRGPLPLGYHHGVGTVPPASSAAILGTSYREPLKEYHSLCNMLVVNPKNFAIIGHCLLHCQERSGFSETVYSLRAGGLSPAAVLAR